MKHLTPYFIVGAILVIALLVRLHRVLEPLADWHSWRQADTAAVTRRYVYDGIDLLRPRYDDLSSIPSGRPNPEGYRMVEFPFVNAVTAWTYQNLPILGELEIHVYSRIVSIFFSLGSIVFLYLLVKLLSSPLEAALAAIVFALLPYNIYYSRTILPEVPLVFFTLGAIYFLVHRLALKKNTLSADFWLAAIFASLALLLKPYAIFLGLPLAYLAFRHHGWKLLSQKGMYIFVAIAIIPLVLWRLWIQQFPEGIPAFMWLLNGNGIRFKGAWFRWIFADRIGRLILGYFGLIPLALGLIAKPKAKEGWVYHIWLLAILAFLAVFATGNVQHDYYQIITIPIISIFVAKGMGALLKPASQFSPIIAYSLVTVSCLFMLAFSWFHIRDFFNINHPEIVEAGRAADEIIPKDAKVIAPYGGDTAFLYQINRRGWPIGGGIKEKINQGASEYISTVFNDETKLLLKRCRPYIKTETFAIINLRNCQL